jgi:hypothetical protein
MLYISMLIFLASINNMQSSKCRNCLQSLCSSPASFGLLYINQRNSACHGSQIGYVPVNFQPLFFFFLISNIVVVLISSHYLQICIILGVVLMVLAPIGALRQIILQARDFQFYSWLCCVHKGCWSAAACSCPWTFHFYLFPFL